MAELQQPLSPVFERFVRFGILRKAFEVDSLLYPVSFRNLAANSLALMRLSDFKFRCLTPLLVPGRRCSNRLEFPSFILAVRL